MLPIRASALMRAISSLDYSRYTCYGCHEHTPDNIRREHIEEGIRDFDNCVECHRNADEHDIRGRGNETREGGREEKDD